MAEDRTTIEQIPEGFLLTEDPRRHRSTMLLAGGIPGCLLLVVIFGLVLSSAVPGSAPFRGEVIGAVTGVLCLIGVLWAFRGARMKPLTITATKDAVGVGRGFSFLRSIPTSHISGYTTTVTAFSGRGGTDYFVSLLFGGPGGSPLGKPVRVGGMRVDTQRRLAEEFGKLGIRERKVRQRTV